MRAPALAALVLAAALAAGCSKPAPAPPDDGLEGLRLHVLVPTMVPGDYDLLVPAANATLPHGLASNPGPADPALLEGGGIRPAAAYASLHARPGRPGAQIHSVAVEFDSAPRAAEWAGRVPRLDASTQFLLLDGRFATLVTGPGAELPDVHESARHLSEYLGVRAICQAGAWPAPLSSLPDPRPGAAPLGLGGSPEQRMDVVGAERWFRVTPGNLTFVNVDMRLNGTPAPRIELRDANLELLATAGPAPFEDVTSRLQATLPAGPSHLFVRAMPLEPCRSEHAFRLDIDAVSTAPDGDNNLSLAHDKEPGLYGPFSLYPAGDEDWYRVRLDEAESRLTVGIRATDGERGGRTVLELYDDGAQRRIDRKEAPALGQDEGLMGNDLPRGFYFIRVLAVEPEVVYRYTLDIRIESPPPAP